MPISRPETLDESAFERLVEPFRSELRAHCHRMLGSLHDAEDALQETMLRAWRGLAGFEGRSSVRSWLYAIATNTCLDAIARRPKRVLPIDYGPPSDPHGAPGGSPVSSISIERLSEGEPAPDREPPEDRYELSESVELAFVAALQRLTPKQRAALVLREALGFSAAEVADALGTSVPSVNSALQRARRSLDEHTPERSAQETLRSMVDERARDRVEAYVDAWSRDDIEAVVEGLADEAGSETRRRLCGV
jgi:RNA polymerase sigma-70 factor, ECF subfamily